MTSVDEKLRRGFALIERAHGDADLLGVALLALQGALEDHLRDTLRRLPDLRPDDRQFLEERGASCRALVDLAQQYGLLDEDQRESIIEADRVQESFARGVPLSWRADDVASYAEFVAVVCDRAPAPAPVPRRQQGRGTGRVRASPPPKWADQPGRHPQLHERPPAGLSWRIILLLVAITILLVLVALVLITPLLQQPEPEIAAVPTATIDLSTPTPAPTPTPLARPAQIVRLGGGPGWLHEEPAFDSPTLPPRLSEGDIVTVLPTQTTDSDGNPWIFVEAGGYQGWSPLNNIEYVEPTPAP